jgi:hypothetical protein
MVTIDSAEAVGHPAVSGVFCDTEEVATGIRTVKIVVGMQHPSTTSSETVGTPKKSADA